MSRAGIMLAGGALIVAVALERHAARVADDAGRVAWALDVLATDGVRVTLTAAGEAVVDAGRGLGPQGKTPASWETLAARMWDVYREAGDPLWHQLPMHVRQRWQDLALGVERDVR